MGQIFAQIICPRQAILFASYNYFLKSDLYLRKNFWHLVANEPLFQINFLFFFKHASQVEEWILILSLKLTSSNIASFRAQPCQRHYKFFTPSLKIQLTVQPWQSKLTEPTTILLSQASSWLEHVLLSQSSSTVSSALKKSVNQLLTTTDTASSWLEPGPVSLNQSPSLFCFSCLEHKCDPTFNHDSLLNHSHLTSSLLCTINQLINVFTLQINSVYFKLLW